MGYWPIRRQRRRSDNGQVPVSAWQHVQMFRSTRKAILVRLFDNKVTQQGGRPALHVLIQCYTLDYMKGRNDIQQWQLRDMFHPLILGGTDPNSLQISRESSLRTHVQIRLLLRLLVSTRGTTSSCPAKIWHLFDDGQELVIEAKTKTSQGKRVVGDAEGSPRQEEIPSLSNPK